MNAALGASLQLTGASKTLAITATPTIAGDDFENTTVLVPHSAAAAIPLGILASLGWILIINRDPTNFITILTGTGGVVFAKLFPGEPCLFRAGSGVTAPFWLANSADAEAEVLLLEI